MLRSQRAWENLTSCPTTMHTLLCKLSRTLAYVQTLTRDITDHHRLCNLKLACLSHYSGGPEVEPVICRVNRPWQRRVTQTVMRAMASGGRNKQLGDGNFTGECYQISLCKSVIWSLSIYLPLLPLLSSHGHRTGANVIPQHTARIGISIGRYSPSNIDTSDLCRNHRIYRSLIKSN